MHSCSIINRNKKKREQRAKVLIKRTHPQSMTPNSLKGNKKRSTINMCTCKHMQQVK